MKIVFHGTNAANFRPGLEQYLDAKHDILCLPDNLDQPGERSHYSSADVIVGIRLGSHEPAPENVRLYHAPAAGTDAIDSSLLPKGALLCNCFGHEDAIAEYVMAALLLRHVPIDQADRRLREGHWDYWAGSPNALRTELGSQKIGLLGYGHIGKAIAARAKAFGMTVNVANRSPVAAGNTVDSYFHLTDLGNFFGSADVIVSSLPLLETTRGFVGKAELAAMRPHAWIVNVGRGPVIDEQSLFDALSGNTIGGAIIDTWYQYPTKDGPVTQPSELPFHHLRNVVMTPHMSGWTDGTVKRRQMTMAANINSLARGGTLTNIVQ